MCTRTVARSDTIGAVRRHERNRGHVPAAVADMRADRVRAAEATRDPRAGTRAAAIWARAVLQRRRRRRRRIRSVRVFIITGPLIFFISVPYRARRRSRDHTTTTTTDDGPVCNARAPCNNYTVSYTFIKSYNRSYRENGVSTKCFVRRYGVHCAR